MDLVPVINTNMEALQTSVFVWGRRIGRELIEVWQIFYFLFTMEN
jgi:hypothetical protein